MAVRQPVSLFPEAGPYQPHSKCDILSSAKQYSQA